MKIFFDMDGTVAEWKTLTIKAEEDIQDVLNNILNTPKYFATLKCYENIKRLMYMLKEQNYDVYVLSCYRPDAVSVNKHGVIQKSTPLNDKKEWLKEHIPFIDEDHQFFVPDGVNKAKFLKDYYHINISTEDILVDDYHKNLKEWAKAGGTPIKCINGINSPDANYFHVNIAIDYMDNYRNDYEQLIGYLNTLDKEFLYDR